MSSIRRTSLPMLAAAVLAVAGASFLAEPALAQRGRGRDDDRGRHGRDHRDNDRSARVTVRAERQPRQRVVRVERQPRQRVVRVERQPRQRVVVVRPAPPQPRVVVVPARPRPNVVWVEGYWRWNGRDYVWVNGHWIADRPGRRYRQARWEQRGADWTFVAPSWSVEVN